MRQFDEFCASINQKEITVIGVGVSNAPLIRMLCAHGARVTACDRNESLDQEPWKALGVTLRLGEGYLDNLDGELIFRTPGLRPDHPALVGARKKGSVVTSEIEVFLRVCPCPVIGVTGSDGKTTTTTLIGLMLREQGIETHVGGNIGQPLLDRAGAIKAGDRCVLELSSFQLSGLTVSPQTAVITNVAPNHLDWHVDMEEYIDAKKNIFSFQSPGGVTVLNGGCAVTAAMRGAYETRFFDAGQIQEGVIDGVLPLRDIRIKGAHNVENYMAAMCALRGQVSGEAILRVAKTFAGVPHRNQLIGECAGVRYFNDSIGSSPSRTVATLGAHEDKVILIAGGYDKKIPFDALARALPEHASAALLIGETAGSIRAAAEAVEGCPPLYDAGNLEKAVSLARSLARPGDVVLLSPACASFDQYRNFEERGEHFAALVKEMEE